MSLLQTIPYQSDSTLLFQAVAEEPWAVFLDSGRPYSTQGRYDIIAADPTATLVVRGGELEWSTRERTERLLDDPFSLLRKALHVQPIPLGAALPFSGGAIGYFGYDLARRLEFLPSIAEDDAGMPEMVIGIYDWAVVVDHERRRSWLVGQERDPATAAYWQERIECFTTPQAPNTEQKPFRVKGTVHSNLDQSLYAEAFHKIKQYIREGDCYQVNLSQRFSAACEGDPWLGYCSLRKLNPSPFGAYLNTPYGQILSCSPERFLRVRDQEVETQPIKGTRPRAANIEEEGRRIENLRSSAKDRAENLMIVDLLRNDLGKSCEPGSVHVSKMFNVESFATVHHLVSTVRGRLAQGEDAVSLLRGCFPGGSITGAPKLRAMEIIEELEPCRRGVYCGAIGYLGFDGGMDINIAIRTLAHRDGVLYFSAGGGIVADSELEAEYRETFDKAGATLNFLKSH